MITSVLKTLLMAQQIKDKRFMDIAQTLYIQEILKSEGIGTLIEADRRAIFKAVATICFEAAEEFSSVFGGVEE